jgi:hypothetical protein
MGGAAASKDHAVYVRVPDPFFRQHDARLRPGWSQSCSGWSGQISLFDDQSDHQASARGLVLDVVVGAADGGSTGDCGTGSTETQRATVAWQFEGHTNSPGQGSFRISADGSRVIGWGLNGTRGLVFTEVDLKGHDLLDFYFTNGDSSYRVIKVPLSAFDRSVLRRTAGLP